MRAVPFAALALCVLPLLGCVPGESGNVSEVQGQGAVPATAPSWPAEGPASAETLQAGVVADLTTAPDSGDFYVPTRSEATCVAQRVVGDQPGAARLNELGFRPDQPVSRLTAIGWTPEERSVLATVFSECVDLQDAFTKVLVGDFRFDTKSAACLAKGLADRAVLGEWATAWSERREVDVMGNEARIGRELVRESEVCLGRYEFIVPEQDMTALRPQPTTPAPAGG